MKSFVGLRKSAKHVDSSLNSIILDAMNKNDLIQYIREQIEAESKSKFYYDIDADRSQGRVSALEDLADHFKLDLDTD